MKKTLIIPLVLWSGVITFLLVLVYAYAYTWYGDNIRVFFFSETFFPLEPGPIWFWIALIAVVKHFLLLLLMRKRKMITTQWMIGLVLGPWMFFIPVFWITFFLFGPPQL